ncbi:MAG: ATP synthase F1 subunit delta [Myxococcota bacterium]
MQDGTIGRRYARALALALGEKDVQALEQVDEQLNALSALLDARTGHAEFRQAMLNPRFPPEVRQHILSDLLETYGFHEVARQFMKLLVEKERLRYLPSIARAFRAEVDLRVGRVRAQITSARALEQAAVQQIVAALEKRTGKRVVPELEVQPEVLGGVAARIGGQVFDNTVRAQLERLRSAISA